MKRVTEVYEDDAALDDAGEADGEAAPEELELGQGGLPSDEEPEERLPRSQKLAAPRSVRRR